MSPTYPNESYEGVRRAGLHIQLGRRPRPLGHLNPEPTVRFKRLNGQSLLAAVVYLSTGCMGAERLDYRTS